MANSVQRLIVMILLLNVILTLVGSFVYSVSDAHLLSEADTYLETYQNWTYDIETGFPNPTTDSGNVYIDKSYGDVTLGQKGFWEILKGGVSITYGGGCMGEDCSVSYVNWLVKGVQWILRIINILAILEVVYLVYSKKHT